MTRELRVAIIGGGPAGICLCRNLHEHATKTPGDLRLSVHVYDRNARPGFGGPFGIGTEVFFCNQRSVTMGFSPSNADSFARWIAAHPLHSRMPDAWQMHPPRRVFGEYLGDLFEETERLFADAGGALTYCPADVQNVCESMSGVEILLGDGTIQQFDIVVLAIGSLPSTVYAELRGKPNYFHSAYPIHRIVKDIRQTSKVLVVGSSLSAVDVANGLKHFGHRGAIMLASRHGRIPGVLSPGVDYRPQVVPSHLGRGKLDGKQLNLNDLMRLLAAEMSCAMSMPICSLDISSILNAKESSERFLERSYRASRHPQLYQSVLRSLAPYVEWAYQRLTMEDRIKACGASAWKQFRHTIARPTARRFLSLLRKKEVAVRSHLYSIENTAKGFEVRFKRSPASCSVETVDVVVNATGAGSNVAKLHDLGMVSPLLRSLLQRGTIQPFPAGGVKVTPSTWNLIDAAGAASSRLYATGQLLQGSVFYCSGMDAVAKYTDQVAAAITRRKS